LLKYGPNTKSFKSESDLEKVNQCITIIIPSNTGARFTEDLRIILKQLSQLGHLKTMT